MFPGCQVGAMPPFGNLYGMTVIVDESLSGNKEIASKACSHAEVIEMGKKPSTPFAHRSRP